MSLLVPDLSDRDGALKAVHTAAVIAFVSAGFTVAIILYVRVSGDEMLGIDLWALIDVALAVGLGVATYRGSRAAAVGLVALQVLNMVLRIVGGETGGLVLASLILVAYVNGVRGAWALHRMRDDDDLGVRIDALAEAPARAAESGLV